MMIKIAYLNLMQVSISMALNPKAESPMTAQTNLSLMQALAAMANGIPTPMVPKVPASILCLGRLWLIIVLPISMVLAPSPIRK